MGKIAEKFNDADFITHHFGGGTYIKEMHLPPGSAIVQHRHAFEHLAYLVSGEVDVLADDVTTRHVGPACLQIPAGVHHGVRAIKPSVWLCIWPTESTDPDEVDEGVALKPAVDMQAMADGMLTAAERQKGV